MQKTGKHFKVVVLSVIVVLFATIAALFCVSYSAWTNGVLSVDSDGTIGLFYISYANDTTVRTVSAELTENNSYTYRNYICIRSDTPGIAYIDLDVSSDDATVYDVTLLSLTATRAATDADGVPSGDKSAIIVYGSPRTVGDISNSYLAVEFGAGADRFYALEFTVTTSAPATFTLTATARDTSVHVVLGETYLGTKSTLFGAHPHLMMSDTAGGNNADPNIDKTITTELAAGEQFKAFMLKSDNTKSYYTANALNLTGGADVVKQSSGDDVLVSNETAKYRIRCYGADYGMGNYDTSYDIDKIWLRSDAGAEVEYTAENAGYYAVGNFSEFGIYEKYKMLETDYEGIYEYASPTTIPANTYYYVARVYDGGMEIVTEKTMLTTFAAQSLYYDAFAGEIMATCPAFRFVVDFGDVAQNSSDNLRLMYRTSITGELNEIGMNNIADSYPYTIRNTYYVDLDSAVDLASVAVFAVSHGDRQNSFDIDAVTVGDGTFAFRRGASYRVTETDQTNPRGDGYSGNNWKGTVARFGNGVYGVTQAFGLPANGYVVAYSSDGFTTISMAQMTVSPSDMTEYAIDMDTLEDGAHAALVNGDFLIYHNGNALASALDDVSPLIAHTVGESRFAIVDGYSEYARGLIKISCKRPFGDNNGDSVHVGIVYGAAAREDQVLTGSDKPEFYAVGQFSDWKVYPSYKFAVEHDRIRGVYVLNIPGIVTLEQSAELATQYKIVRIDPGITGTSQYKWFGTGELALGGNAVATDKTLYVDLWSMAYTANGGVMQSRTAEQLASTTRVIMDLSYMLEKFPNTGTNPDGSNIYDENGENRQCTDNTVFHYWNDSISTVWGDKKLAKLTDAIRFGDIDRTDEFQYLVGVIVSFTHYYTYDDESKTPFHRNSQTSDVGSAQTGYDDPVYGAFKTATTYTLKYVYDYLNPGTGQWRWTPQVTSN